MKRLNCSLVAAALAVVALCGSSAMAAHLANPNRLADPSFEGTLTYDGAPFVGFWEGFSNTGGTTPPSTAEFTTTMPLTGPQVMELNVGDVNGFAGAFQDATFSSSLAGNMAWFSGWHKSLGVAGGSEIRIEWRDSVNNVEVSRTPNLTPTVGSTYEEFVLSATIPAGADTARVVYAIQSFGAGVSQQVFVDDVNFNVVPEPASFALLGLASLALVGMRRRI